MSRPLTAPIDAVAAIALDVNAVSSFDTSYDDYLVLNLGTPNHPEAPQTHPVRIYDRRPGVIQAVRAAQGVADRQMLEASDRLQELLNQPAYLVFSSPANGPENAVNIDVYPMLGAKPQAYFVVRSAAIATLEVEAIARGAWSFTSDIHAHFLPHLRGLRVMAALATPSNLLRVKAPETRFSSDYGLRSPQARQLGYIEFS